MAKLFHGRAIKEVLTLDETIVSHDWEWKIGPVVKLKVRTILKEPATFKFSLKEGELVQLWCSPDGKQFYFRGGDQEIDLQELGLDGPEWFRDKMEIGEAIEITYQDRKSFHRFDLIDYFHRLGEVTRKKPRMMYDTLNKRIEVWGGQYYVETRDLVDGVSPGIVN